MANGHEAGRASVGGWILLGVLAGAALALGAQALLRGTVGAPDDAPDGVRPRAEAPPVAPAPPAAPRGDPDLATPPPERPDASGLAGRLGEGNWSKEELEFARDAILEERRRQEAARIRSEDSGLDVLTRVLEARANPEALLADPAAFAAHVRSVEGPAARIEATGGPSPTLVGDADLGSRRVVEFGAGTFTLDARRWSDLRDDVDAIEVRGAGMDATTLVLGNDLLFVAADLEHLRVRDLTIDGGSRGESALDLRGRAAAVFERVRLRSWWPHAGHGSPLGVSGQAYLALLDCVVDGGVGKPTGGFVVSLRGPALVVAKGCRFSDVDAVVIGTTEARGSRVRLLDCVFRNAPLADSRITDGRARAPFIDVRVIGGEVALLGAGVAEEVRRRTWGAPFAAEVRDVAFGPDLGIPTIADVLSLLEWFEAPAGQRVVEVEVESSGRGDRPPTFAVFTWDGKVGRPVRWQVLGVGTGAVTKRNDVGGGTGMPPFAAIDAALPLLEALRRSGLPSDAPVERVLYGSPRAAGSPATVRWLKPGRDLGATLDGGDGSVVAPSR